MHDDTSVVLALVAIVGSVITALFALLNKNTKALNRVARASDSVAEATAQSAKEAKERNGHLGDQSLKLAALVSAQNKDIEEVKVNTGNIAETLNKSALIAAEDRVEVHSETTKTVKKV